MTKTELIQSLAIELSSALGLDDQLGDDDMTALLDNYFKGELLIRVSRPQLETLLEHIPTKYKGLIDLDNEDDLLEISQFVGQGLYNDISIGMATLAYKLEQTQ